MYDKRFVEVNINNSPFSNFLTSRYSITFNVRVKETYDFCKCEGLSFFNLSLAILLEGLNSVSEMRWRIIEGDVFEFEKIDAITPILKDDKNISEIRVKPVSEFSDFYSWYGCLEDMKSNLLDFEFSVDTTKRDILPIANFSCIPWIDFTSITSILASPHQVQPLITWGKYVNGSIPVALTVSHLFIYGYHFKLFNDKVSFLFSNPSDLF